MRNWCPQDGIEPPSAHQITSRTDALVLNWYGAIDGTCTRFGRFHRAPPRLTAATIAIIDCSRDQTASVEPSGT